MTPKIIFLSFILFAFINIIKAQNNVMIQGKVLNSSEITEIYLDDIVTEIELGSSKIGGNGEFKIEIKLDTANYLKLRLSQYQVYILIVSPGDNFKLEIDSKDPDYVKVEGSNHNRILYDAIVKKKKLDHEIDSITSALNKKSESYFVNLVSTNQDNLLSLYLLEFLDKEANADLYAKIAKNLLEKYPTNYFVKSMQANTKSENEGLALGTLAPEISLPDKDGKNISLSSLRGKVVLIDFWASWCGPCVREIPSVIKAYEKYRKKGFEVYGVSLDAEKDAWLNAIETHKMKWIHVSDLKYWDSQVVGLYGIDGIPFTVLVDVEGKILAKNLRGEDLMLKLDEIYKNQ